MNKLVKSFHRKIRPYKKRYRSKAKKYDTKVRYRSNVQQ